MNDEPMTLREIADDLGISPQSVAEILERAYKKIRSQLAEKHLRAEDLLP